MEERTNRFQEDRDFDIRDAEIRDNLMMDYVHPLSIPRKIIPEGMDYQWIVDTVRGDYTFSQVARSKRYGWVPVPASRHPDLCEGETAWRSDVKTGYVHYQGLVLCERPLKYTQIQQQMHNEYYMKLMQSLPGTEQLRGTPGMPMQVFADEVTTSKARSFKND